VGKQWVEYPAAPAWQHQREATVSYGSPSIIDSFAALTRYFSGQIIYDEGTAVECWYRIASGIARRFNVRADGRRQIVDLLLPGDVFGFGARGRHAFAAEAIRDGTVVNRYPRARLETVAATDPRVACMLREMALEETRRLQDLILILGQTTAQQKVGAFLAHLADRLAGRPADQLNLPISRYDIADYLALSVETVSRALTALRGNGAIALAGPRRVSIVSRDLLNPPDPLRPDFGDDFETAAPRRRGFA
jgi:CRP/FNR family transcriptional regulator, nitrogen fixation regulation protein